jgi:hypothetical protein
LICQKTFARRLSHYILEEEAMRRFNIVFATTLLIQLFAILGFAQADRLAGKWEGKTVSPQGERPTTAVFKKDGSGYSGAITGKLDGDKLTAKAEVETPQGNLTINYAFTLENNTLKGKGSLDFNGNPFSFDVDLKRAADDGAAPTSPATPPPVTQAPTAPPTQAPQERRQRIDVPQPQQKQSIDYFVGQWSFKYIGRESAFGPAPREGVATFTKRPDGKSVAGTIVGKHDGGAFKETSVITFDEATKMMTFSEKLSSGLQVNSKGDWSSPIAIRFTIEPVKVKGQTLQLKRTISIVAAHSFSVTEELSEDGGPFVRLGNTLFTRVDAK